MKPSELAHILEVLTDRRRLKVPLESYRRRGQVPFGRVSLADVCQATELTREKRALVVEVCKLME